MQYNHSEPSDNLNLKSVVAQAYFMYGLTFI